MNKTTVMQALINFVPRRYYYRGQFVSSIEISENGLWYNITLSGGMKYLVDGNMTLGVRDE